LYETIIMSTKKFQFTCPQNEKCKNIISSSPGAPFPPILLPETAGTWASLPPPPGRAGGP
ncbi:MAG: hypothetical protein IJT88_09135, partial [Kiritimatiellae bacterium]|nr:hypothetical protein [Kiritimatiellia bacterium]